MTMKLRWWQRRERRYHSPPRVLQVWLPDSGKWVVVPTVYEEKACGACDGMGWIEGNQCRVCKGKGTSR